jgi:hypothetical protein
MTAAALRRRLDRLERYAPAQRPVRIDWSVLSEEDQDRVDELYYCLRKDGNNQAALTELYSYAAFCPPVGPDGPRNPRIWPPCELQLYWRFERINGADLPRGNYYFGNLSRVQSQRLINLCLAYGWNTEADVVEIAPIGEWRSDDAAEMRALLFAAIPETELRYIDRGP